MRIVHLSDFHLDATRLEDFKNYVITPLIQDLKKFNNSTNIDLVIFSGDLIDKGGLSFDNDIDLAFLTFFDEVITPLMSALNLPLSRFFFGPGNHDMLFSSDGLRAEAGLINTLISPEKLTEFIYEIDRDGVVDGLNRNVPFKEFEKDYYKDFDGEKSLSLFNSAFKIDLPQMKVGISSLNSSWRSYKDRDDHGKVLIGELQITRSRSFIDDCDVKFAILHHPIDFIADFEKRQIEAMLLKDYDILFTGHIHEGSSSTKTNLYGSTLISVAPSNWTSNVRLTNVNHMNGYSIIDFQKGVGATINHRRYSHGKQEFVANVDLSGDGESGKSIIRFPNESEISESISVNTILKKIKEIHIEHIDQHLISYETDTIAPKKINELFVLPKIVHKEEEVKDDVSEIIDKSYSIEDLANTNNNLLLVGTKEAGKTILMDKILIESVENFNTYKKIPVFVDFEEVKGSRFETIISRYLGCSVKEVSENILKKHDILLMVDNLSFGSRFNSLVKQLELFMTSHSNVTVIATCTSQTESELPAEALSQPIIQSFKPLFIKSFKTKEIRELMEKWFSGSERLSDSRTELEQLIKTLSDLSISRTPFAISMFLWIIEKQESYAPVNNAQMLENFLERLLSKTTFNEVYASEFTYRNKVLMLTEIALFMYEKDEINYRLTKHDLRNFIHDQLKIKKFDFDEVEILDQFIKKGIFSVEKIGTETYVKFKFSCFFQFFLMKNIDKNSAFKSHVFQELNFLNFVEELDYYSGLKIDDIELLEFVIEKMDDSYTDIIKAFENLSYSFDNPFETNNALIERLESSSIEVLTKKNEVFISHDQQQDAHFDDDSEIVILNKQKEIAPITQLERLWILSAKVLKNTEEITKEDLKSIALRKVVKSSLAFAAIYKFLLTDFASQQEEEKAEDDQIRIIGKFLPFIHEILVHQTLGTGKLRIVLEEILDESLSDKSTSDFEKFTYVFLYADLNGKRKYEYIQKFINNSTRFYIKDMIFLKLMEYYHRKDISSDEEIKYKNFIGDILTRDDGEGTQRRDYHRKGKIISKIEREKKERILLDEAE